MLCSRCNGNGFWCDVCGQPELNCDCDENPETGGPNIIECEDCTGEED